MFFETIFNFLSSKKLFLKQIWCDWLKFDDESMISSISFTKLMHCVMKLIILSICNANCNKINQFNDFCREICCKLIKTHPNSIKRLAEPSIGGQNPPGRSVWRPPKRGGQTPPWRGQKSGVKTTPSGGGQTPPESRVYVFSTIFSPPTGSEKGQVPRIGDICPILRVQKRRESRVLAFFDT